MAPAGFHSAPSDGCQDIACLLCVFVVDVMNAPASIKEYLESLQYEGKLEKWSGDLVLFLKEEEVTVRFAYAGRFGVCSLPVFVGYGAAGQRGLR